MGSYNSVMVECPDCGKANEKQSKGGTCSFEEKTTEEAAISDLAAIEGDPIKCGLCGTTYYILLKCFVQIRKASHRYLAAKESGEIYYEVNNEVVK